METMTAGDVEGVDLMGVMQLETHPHLRLLTDHPVWISFWDFPQWICGLHREFGEFFYENECDSNRNVDSKTLKNDYMAQIAGRKVAFSFHSS